MALLCVKAKAIFDLCTVHDPTAELLFKIRTGTTYICGRVRVRVRVRACLDACVRARSRGCSAAFQNKDQA